MAVAFSLTSLSSINVRRRTRTSSSPIHSSLSKNDNTSSSTSPSSPKPQRRTPPRPQLQKQRKPSLAQIERAIGAGEFRDRNPNPNRDSGEPDKSLLDVLLSNTIEREEYDLEKKLRETGEWLIDRTEGNPVSGTAGKKNLVMTAFQLLIPIWILAFFVASGILKLPFSSPLIDDLIM